MLLIISWNQYFLYTSLALLIYYAFIIVRFYRRDILQIILLKAAGKKSNLSKKSAISTVGEAADPSETVQNLLYRAVHDFADELKVLLKQSAAQQSGKIEITATVAKLLQKYPSLKGSSFQISITHLIAAESETNCNIKLSPEELASVWI